MNTSTYVFAAVAATAIAGLALHQRRRKKTGSVKKGEGEHTLKEKHGPSVAPSHRQKHAPSQRQKHAPSQRQKYAPSRRQRLLIILGEADDLKAWLRRDILLSMVVPLAADGKVDLVDHELVADTSEAMAAALSAGHAAPGLPACGTRVEVRGFEVTLLSNPTSLELGTFLKQYGEEAKKDTTSSAWPGYQSIIYNGHGGEDGTISLQDVDMSGGKLYLMISTSLGAHVRELHLYLNCCYGEEIFRSCAAKVSQAKLNFVDGLLIGALRMSRAEFTEGRATYEEFLRHFEYEAEDDLMFPKAKAPRPPPPGEPVEGRVEPLPIHHLGEGVVVTTTDWEPFDEHDMAMLRNMRRIDGRALPMTPAGRDLGFCVHPLGLGPIPPDGALVRALQDAHHAKPLTTLTDEWLDTVADTTANARRTRVSKLTGEEVDYARDGWFSEDTPLIGLFHVGSGDAMIMSLPNKKRGKYTTVMLDGGMKKHAETFWTLALGGFRTLNHLFVSHSDGDHIRGIEVLADSGSHADIGLNVQCLYISSPLQGRGHAELINKVVEGLGARRRLDLTKGDKIKISDTCMAYVLSPTKDLRAKLLKKLAGRGPTIYNEAALALLFVWRRGGKQRTLLFTSDSPGRHVAAGLTDVVKKYPGELGEDVLPRAEDEAFIVDYMDIPHHGSRHDSPPELFSTVRARTYGWSSDGGRKFRTTMADARVMKRMIDAHRDQLPADPRTVFTFPAGAWARDRVAGSEDGDVMSEEYADPEYGMTWVMP